MANAANTGQRRIVHVLHPDDNVATALIELAAGTAVPLPRDGQTLIITVRQPIPFGHKLAIAPIAEGQPVRKYGEVMGLATSDIALGDHVHVHNVESQRGRGDLHPT